MSSDPRRRDRIVRDDWLAATTRSCQLFAGRMMVEFDGDQFDAAARAFVDALPPTRSRAEQLVLSGLLVGLSLRWFAHTRTGDAATDDPIPLDILYDSQPGRATAMFVEWAGA